MRGDCKRLLIDSVLEYISPGTGFYSSTFEPERCHMSNCERPEWGAGRPCAVVDSHSVPFRATVPDTVLGG